MKKAILAAMLVSAVAAGAAFAMSHEKGEKSGGHDHDHATAHDEKWSARAILANAEGTNVGRADLVETPHGVKIRVEFRNMDPGVHAFHIHETGKCEPPYTSAGGHFNPTGKEHGFKNPAGYHLGDMPNVHIPESGALTLEVYVPGVTIKGEKNALLDDDGAALMVHLGADDEKSDPAGHAGARISCGVIKSIGTAEEADITAAPPI